MVLHKSHVCLEQLICSQFFWKILQVLHILFALFISFGDQWLNIGAKCDQWLDIGAKCDKWLDIEAKEDQWLDIGGKVDQWLDIKKNVISGWAKPDQWLDIKKMWSVLGHWGKMWSVIGHWRKSWSVIGHWKKSVIWHWGKVDTEKAWSEIGHWGKVDQWLDIEKMDMGKKEIGKNVIIEWTMWKRWSLIGHKGKMWSMTGHWEKCDQWLDTWGKGHQWLDTVGKLLQLNENWEKCDKWLGLGGVNLLNCTVVHYTWTAYLYCTNRMWTSCYITVLLLISS